VLPHKQGSGISLLITTAHTAELFLTFTDVKTGVHVRQHTNECSENKIEQIFY